MFLRYGIPSRASKLAFSRVGSPPHPRWQRAPSARSRTRQLWPSLPLVIYKQSEWREKRAIGLHAGEDGQRDCGASVSGAASSLECSVPTRRRPDVSALPLSASVFAAFVATPASSATETTPAPCFAESACTTSAVRVCPCAALLHGALICESVPELGNINIERLAFFMETREVVNWP
jgi:hypothetical protein